MQQTTLAVVEDTPDILPARLKREWETINALKQAGEVDYSAKEAVLKLYPLKEAEEVAA